MYPLVAVLVILFTHLAIGKWVWGAGEAKKIGGPAELRTGPDGHLYIQIQNKLLEHDAEGVFLVRHDLAKMGVETVAAVSQAEDLVLSVATCQQERGPILVVANGEPVPLSTNLEEILHQTQPDVLVDFTNAAACMNAASIAAGRSVNLVLGASGLTDENFKQLDAMAHDNNVGITDLFILFGNWGPCP